MSVDPSDSEVIHSDWSVDWVDVVTGAVAAIATAFFESLADTIATVIDVVAIRPLVAIRDLLVGLTMRVTTILELSLDFGPANRFADAVGFPGAVVVVGGGLLLVALVVNRVIRG